MSLRREIKQESMVYGIFDQNRNTHAGEIATEVKSPPGAPAVFRLL